MPQEEIKRDSAIHERVMLDRWNGDVPGGGSGHLFCAAN